MRNSFHILLVIALCFVSGCDSVAEKGGEQFTKALKNKISEGQTQISIAELYPGDWELVCILTSTSTGGKVDSEMLRNRFKIEPKQQLQLPNGLVSTSDWNWGLIFFTPPSKIEMISIDNRNILSQMLRHRNDPIYPACIEKESVGIRYFPDAITKHDDQISIQFYRKELD